MAQDPRLGACAIQDLDDRGELGSVSDLLTPILDRKCEFIAIHEQSKDDIMHPDGFRKTDGLPREPFDTGP